MARSTYDDALNRLLAHEGGYTNHPSDPGGPTNFGITIYDYRKYVKPNAKAADVKAMKLVEAKNIYRAKSWDALRCDQLPAGLDYSIFDYGVNSGIGRAGKVLRRVCGLPDNTWHVTAEVLTAVEKRGDKALIGRVNAERLAFLHRLRTWPVFGKGWGRRVSEVKAHSLWLADRALPAQPVPIGPTSNDRADKGVVPLPKPVKQAIENKGKVIGGKLSADAAGGASFWDWVQSHPYEAGAIVVGGVLIIGCGLYAIERWHRAKQEAPTPGIVPVPIKLAA